jgi:UDP-N-acetylmuramyl pentapeptide phosphotransferase/UDP-N-acetylglucosamine-1-phosphate transferase
MLRCPVMVKLLIILVLGVVALSTLRNWLLSRSIPPDRREADDRGHPPVGALLVIVATFVLLLAVFVLPRVIDALP